MKLIEFSVGNTARSFDFVSFTRSDTDNLVCMQTFSSQSPYCEMFVLAIREREERYKVQSISQLICNYFCGALLMQNKISFFERLLSFCIKILSNLRILRRIIIFLKLNPSSFNSISSVLFGHCYKIFFS